jgi:CHASE3 domain sensor protein
LKRLYQSWRQDSRLARSEDVDFAGRSAVVVVVVVAVVVVIAVVFVVVASVPYPATSARR